MTARVDDSPDCAPGMSDTAASRSTPKPNRRAAAKGAALLSAGQFASLAISLTRNVLLARLLAPEHFGIATTVALTATFLEGISQVGVDRLLVQAKDGSDPRFLATAHVINVARGTILSILVAASAWPVAWFFGATAHLDAYLAVALVPLARGLAHLGVNLDQRSLRFLPSVTLELIGQVVALVTAIAVVQLTRQPVAMSAVLVAQAIAYAVSSHRVTPVPYRWAIDARIARRMLAFGWPMLINGGLLFAILYSDRFIVGPFYGTVALGLLGSAALFATAGANGVTAVISQLTLPLLAFRQSDRSEHLRFTRLLLATCSCAAAFFGSVIILAQAPIVAATFGEAYLDGAPLLGAFAALVAVRMARTALSVMALSRADSMTPMLANVARTAGIALSLAFAALGMPLVWIPLGGLIGELCAFALAAVLCRRAHGLPLQSPAVNLTLLLIALASSGGLTLAMPQLSAALHVMIAILLATCFSASIFLSSSELRQEGTRALRFRARKTRPATPSVADLAGSESVRR